MDFTDLVQACRKLVTIAPALRSPLLHFIVLGGGLYLGVGMWSGERALDDRSVRVEAHDIARLRADWIRDTAREPSAAELQASLSRHIDDEVLLQEAIRLGLDRRDPVVRDRLLRNMQFAFPESRHDDAQRLAEAHALGMVTRDLVVRRRLIQVMEQRLEVGIETTDAELRDYVARHAERYALPARRAFQHIFLSKDTHSGVSADAETLLARLKAEAQSPVERLGDSFLMGREFPLTSGEGIERIFGARFAEEVMAGPERDWFGPVASPYGLHLVRITSSEAAQAPDFETVRIRAAYALRHERAAQVRRQMLAELRSEYVIELPDSPTGMQP